MVDLEEKETLWKQFQKEHKFLKLGIYKKVIYWTYDKLLLNQTYAREEILNLKKENTNLKRIVVYYETKINRLRRKYQKRLFK